MSKFDKEKYFLRFALEDRGLIASRLKEMQKKIQETLDGMEQLKENKDISDPTSNEKEFEIPNKPSANPVEGREDTPPFIRSCPK